MGTVLSLPMCWPGAQPVAEHYSLDGVLTLVDAKHVMRHLDEQKPEGVVNEALAQVAYADRIILNKTDLVGDGSHLSFVSV